MKSKVCVRLAVTSLALVSCSTLTLLTDPKNNLKFADVEKLQPGRTTTSEALNSIGTPDENLTHPELPGQDIWIYTNHKSPSASRLVLYFNHDAHTLRGMAWEVNDSDPESNLENAKSHFQGAHFREEHPEWTNPHAAPTEFFQKDEKLGVSLVVRESTNKVMAITWHDPNQRQVATQPPKAKVHWQP
jgi:hypothetical protein